MAVLFSSSALFTSFLPYDIRMPSCSCKIVNQLYNKTHEEIYCLLGNLCWNLWRRFCLWFLFLVCRIWRERIEFGLQYIFSRFEIFSEPSRCFLSFGPFLSYKITQDDNEDNAKEPIRYCTNCQHVHDLEVDKKSVCSHINHECY